MIKTTLKLGEIYHLSQELNGKIDPATGKVTLPGLLTQKMSLDIKYYLTELNNIVSETVKTVDTLRNEYIQNHGTETEDGRKELTKSIVVDGKEEPNPAYLQFLEEFDKLLSEEKEITHYNFVPSDFKHIDTDYIYPVLFKLFPKP